MSFLRYANISADMLRNVLKEPFKTKAQNRQVIAFRSSPYVDGKQGKQSEYFWEEGRVPVRSCSFIQLTRPVETWSLHVRHRAVKTLSTHHARSHDHVIAIT